MSIDAMKQALAALEQYTNVVTSVNDPNSWVTVADGGKPARDAITALRAAIEQAQTVHGQGGLAEKIPARGTSLEPIVRKAFDRIYEEQDPRRWEDQEPVAWMYHGIRHDDTPHERPSLIWKPDQMDVMSFEKGAKATPLYTTPRQWQGLTDEDREDILRWIEWKEIGSQPVAPQKLIAYVEKKLKEKNT